MPPGVEGKTILEPGSEDPKSWWIAGKTLPEETFNLSAARYRPRVGEKPPEDHPADLIRDAIAVEKDIEDGLRILLREVEQD